MVSELSLDRPPCFSHHHLCPEPASRSTCLLLHCKERQVCMKSGVLYFLRSRFKCVCQVNVASFIAVLLFQLHSKGVFLSFISPEESDLDRTSAQSLALKCLFTLFACRASVVCYMLISNILFKAPSAVSLPRTLMQVSDNVLQQRFRRVTCGAVTPPPQVFPQTLAT